MSGAQHCPLIGIVGIACLSWALPVAGQQPTGDVRERQGLAGREATIVVQIDNYADLSPRDVADAEHEAARIYQGIGVRMRWVHGEAHRAPPCGFLVRVLLLSRDMEMQMSRKEALADTVFGIIARDAGRAYILTHRITRVALGFKDDFRRLLGQTIAHELGHLVLPMEGHAGRGIMRANLGLRAYSAAYFTAEQGVKIRSLLAAAAAQHKDTAAIPEQNWLLPTSPRE
jgi:hypothetical protein